MPITRDYSRAPQSFLFACLTPWDSIGASRKLDVPHSSPKAPARPGLSFERDLLDRASHFSEPEIDRFVMAITSFEAVVRHTARHAHVRLM